MIDHHPHLSPWLILVAEVGAGVSGGHLLDPGGTGAIPTTSTPAVLVGTYTGSHYALRQATLAASPSWSYSLASTAAALTTYPGGLLIGAHPWNTSNTETPYIGRIHWIGIYATALSEGESDALATALYARLQ